MVGTYNTLLVVLSILVAITASYVALDVTSRVTASHQSKAGRYNWLAGGAISMGTGIWSMHFIGMLAWRLPIPVSYDFPITLLSLLIAITISAFALYQVSRATLGVRRLLLGSALMGIGIVSMHYTGMAAMKMDPPIRYESFLFGLSILIALAASAAALWSAFELRMETILSAFWKKAGSAFVMGTAIYGMHYTGMAAAVIAPNTICTVNPQDINNAWFAGTLGGFTLLFLTATLLISAFDAYIAKLSAKYTDSLHHLNVDLERQAAELSHANTMLKQEVQIRIQAEEALRRAHAELEARVAERTTELVHTNESLRKSEEQRQQIVEERERLSRDLHDNIVQTIYAIGMRLEECKRLVRNNPNEVTAQLAQVIDGLNSVIRDVRQYITGSQRQILIGRQLRAELVELVAAIKSTEAPRFQLDVDNTAVEQLTRDEEEQVLSIAREALSNSLQHSHAQQGTIALRLANGGVRLEISDDGEGFDPQQPTKVGGGLHNMKSRARQIGAKLEIQSAPGQGTHIIVYIAKEKKTHDGIG